MINTNDARIAIHGERDQVSFHGFDFIDKIPFYGLAVLCLDNEPVQDLIPRIKKRYTTYGLSAQADFQARAIEYKGLTSRFACHHKGNKIGNVTLNLPGLHNIYNALASIAVGTELDIPFDVIKAALEGLEGVQRRIEVKGRQKGITVVDDYGHHPTEIKITLQAIKESWPNRRKVIVFQPHRYTRTQALFNEFTRAFYQSDILMVLPIYPAGEMQIEGVDAHALYEAIRAHGHKQVLYMENFETAAMHLKKILKKGDILLTLGAGDVWQVGQKVLKDLV